MGTSSSIALGPGAWVPEGALRFSFSRSGGPGGQNVNKVNTKAELRVWPEELQGVSARVLARLRSAAGSRMLASGELQLVADTGRTQEGNRQACLERLRALVQAALREPKVRRKSRPTRGSVERRLAHKRARSQIKRARRESGEW